MAQGRLVVGVDVAAGRWVAVVLVDRGLDRVLTAVRFATGRALAVGAPLAGSHPSRHIGRIWV